MNMNNSNEIVMPRVLVISHTPFTSTNSMGSTLASYFVHYNPMCVAQFYIKDMCPDIPVCYKFFRTTDYDLLSKVKHPFSSSVGRIVELGEENVASHNNEEVYAKTFSREFSLVLRDLLWGLRLWNNREFVNWLDEFDPQLVLIQPGDFSYIIKIALEISKKKNIPLIMHQSEAYYLKPPAKNTLIYWIYRNHYNHTYEAMMKRVVCAVYLCDALKNDYQKCFHVPGYTIMKSTQRGHQLMPLPKNRRFIYGGNIGEKVGRAKPLVELGQALKKLGLNLEVYTGSKGDHLNELNEDNGIILHEPVSYDKLQKEIDNSEFVVHVESFDEDIVLDLKYAFTTKIADMLASGRCPVVYGPDEIASIKYFKDTNSGCVISSKDSLQKMLSELLDDRDLEELYVRNALELAQNYHNPDINAESFNELLSSVENPLLLK